MKNPPMSAAESRLFAVLMRDYVATLPMIEIAPWATSGICHPRGDYREFLKSQSDTRHDNCYAKALRLIREGS